MVPGTGIGKGRLLAATAQSQEFQPLQVFETAMKVQLLDHFEANNLVCAQHVSEEEAV